MNAQKLLQIYLRFAQRRAESNLETGLSVSVLLRITGVANDRRGRVRRRHLAHCKQSWGPRLAGTQARATWYDRSARFSRLASPN